MIVSSLTIIPIFFLKYKVLCMKNDLFFRQKAAKRTSVIRKNDFIPILLKLSLTTFQHTSIKPGTVT